MCKVTECGCPESKFDPKTLRPGDRVVYCGRKCIVTARADSSSRCGFWLVSLNDGEPFVGDTKDYKKPTKPWLLED